jgi:hypothetical protein
MALALQLWFSFQNCLEYSMFFQLQMGFKIKLPISAWLILIAVSSSLSAFLLQ